MEHGHLFFKWDWRYRCFIASGVADGLPALLALAARQAAARQEALERERELDERLDAVGLRRCNVEFGPEITAWLHTGVRGGALFSNSQLASMLFCSGMAMWESVHLFCGRQLWLGIRQLACTWPVAPAPSLDPTGRRH